MQFKSWKMDITNCLRLLLCYICFILSPVYGQVIEETSLDASDMCNPSNVSKSSGGLTHINYPDYMTAESCQCRITTKSTIDLAFSILFHTEDVSSTYCEPELHIWYSGARTSDKICPLFSDQQSNLHYWLEREQSLIISTHNPNEVQVRLFINYRSTPEVNVRVECQMVPIIDGPILLPLNGPIETKRGSDKSAIIAVSFIAAALLLIIIVSMILVYCNKRKQKKSNKEFRDKQHLNNNSNNKISGDLNPAFSDTPKSSLNNLSELRASLHSLPISVNSSTGSGLLSPTGINMLVPPISNEPDPAKEPEYRAVTPTYKPAFTNGDLSKPPPVKPMFLPATHVPTPMSYSDDGSVSIYQTPPEERRHPFDSPDYFQKTPSTNDQYPRQPIHEPIFASLASPENTSTPQATPGYPVLNKKPENSYPKTKNTPLPPISNKPVPTPTLPVSQLPNDNHSHHSPDPEPYNLKPVNGTPNQPVKKAALLGPNQIETPNIPKQKPKKSKGKPKPMRALSPPGPQLVSPMPNPSLYSPPALWSQFPNDHPFNASAENIRFMDETDTESMMEGPTVNPAYRPFPTAVIAPMRPMPVPPVPQDQTPYQIPNHLYESPKQGLSSRSQSRQSLETIL